MKQKYKKNITATRRVPGCGEGVGTYAPAGGPLRGASHSGGPLFNFDDLLSEGLPGSDNHLLLRVTVGRFHCEIGFKNFDDGDFMEVVWSLYEAWKQRRLPLGNETAERFMSAVCDECERQGIEYPPGWLKVLRELREDMAGE